MTSPSDLVAALAEHLDTTPGLPVHSTFRDTPTDLLTSAEVDQALAVSFRGETYEQWTSGSGPAVVLGRYEVAWVRTTPAESFASRRAGAQAWAALTVEAESIRERLLELAVGFPFSGEAILRRLVALDLEDDQGGLYVARFEVELESFR